MRLDYEAVLTREEKAVYALRSIFKSAGYTLYKMSKFEEYDLYARNKDFLVSDNIITFTDTDGRLLALKPDVTLSIIKNYRDASGTQKLFYNENVYRVSRGTGSYREIMQAGLECIGDVTEGDIKEVLSLAERSLAAISPEYVLEVSSLDAVSAVLDYFGIVGEARLRALGYLGEKNSKGLISLARELSLGACAEEKLALLVGLYGRARDVLPKLEALSVNEAAESAINALARAVEGNLDSLNIDFSLLGDMKYYNGIAFSGFVSGIPTAVLRGGQYDRMLERLGKRCRAIGFAVYLDELESLS